MKSKEAFRFDEMICLPKKIYSYIYPRDKNPAAMDTILIQITNEKAYKLMEDLEDLQLIRILQKKQTHYEKLSEKYEGKLKSEVAEEMHEYLSKGREEWKGRNT